MIRHFQIPSKLFFPYLITNLFYAFGSVFFTFIFANIIEAAASQDTHFILQWVVFAIIYMLIYCFISYCYQWVHSLIISENNRLLKDKIFDALFQKSITSFEKENSATYMSDLTSSIERIDTIYYEMLLDIPQMVLTLLFSILASFYLNPLLLVPMLLISCISIAVSQKINTDTSQIANEFKTSVDTYTVTCKEYLEGFSLIKLSGVAVTINQLHSLKNKNMEQLRFQSNKVIFKASYISLVFSLISSVLLVAFAGILASLNLLTLAGVYAVGDLIGKMLYPMSQFATYQGKYKAALPLLERMDFLCANSDSKPTTSSLAPFKTLQVHTLSFTYGEREILHNLTLQFERGKKYCIVGMSGCGKSTLLKLLQGYHTTYTGTLHYNDTEYKETNMDCLSKKIGMLSQSVFLFDASLKDNLTLFQSFSDKEIEDVLVKVGLSDFVKNLPNGLDTFVGENGKSISGGEKTRIALGRLLLMHFDVILLDEVCASLDAESADKIERLILSLDQCVITVSHRLSKSFLEHTQIIVLKDGYLIENAPFEELIQTNGYFHALYQVGMNE